MGSTGRRGLFVLGTFAVAVVAVVAMTPLAAADGHGGEYAVEQGEQCITTTAFADDGRTIEDFYDYRNPYTEPSSSTYSSHGTVDYQQNDASILMMHEGADGVGFVVVHDRYMEDVENATEGGSATFNVTGIDPGEAWAVEDDDYEEQDDEFHHSTDSSEMNWIWKTGRTDGAAYTGLGDDFQVGIDAAWGEDANLQKDSEGYSGDITDWQVVSATGDGFERTSLNSLDEPITIRPGSCDADGGDTGDGSDGGDGDSGGSDQAPDATLEVSDRSPEIGETAVTLNASDSNSTDSVEEFRWDVTGDGEADLTTNEPVVEHVFDDVGERDVTVTLVYDSGETAADSVAVEVVDTTPPAAVLDAPEEATAGEPVEFSGAGSQDNHRIESYEWDFGDGNTAGGVDVEHTYAEAGTYEVELRLIDPSGNENVTTTTVDVQEQDENAGDGATDDSDDRDSGGTDGSTSGSTGGSAGTGGTSGGSTGGSSGSSAGTSGGYSDTSGDDGSGEDEGSSAGLFGASDTVEATVLTENGSVVLLAEDVDAGDTVEADVGFGDGGQLESVQLSVEEDADELRVELEPTAAAVPGRFVERPAYAIRSNADIASVTLEFAVDRRTLDAAGIEADDLVVYARSGEWVPAQTEVADADDRVLATGEVDDVGAESEVAVGAEGAVMYVVDVEAEDPVAGAPFDLQVTVRNTGDEGTTLSAAPGFRESEDGSLRLDVVGGSGGRIHLGPGEGATLDARTTVADPGMVTLRHGASNWTLAVAEADTDPAVVAVDAPESVAADETTTVDVVVHNDRSVPIQGEVELFVDGEPADAAVVRLAPDERATLTFERRFDATGTYELAAGTATGDATGAESTTIEVESADELPQMLETDVDGPGFGPGLALVAVLAAATIVASRRRRDGGE